jgi:hypothetical protein
VALEDTKTTQYDLPHAVSQTAHGRYVLVATNVGRALEGSMPLIGDTGLVVCVVVDDLPRWDRLPVGEHCRVYVAQFTPVGAFYWRATSGELHIPQAALPGLHVDFDASLQCVGRALPPIVLKGHIDFEETFALMHAPPPCMKWALGDVAGTTKAEVPDAPAN